MDLVNIPTCTHRNIQVRLTGLLSYWEAATNAGSSSSSLTLPLSFPTSVSFFAPRSLRSGRSSSSSLGSEETLESSSKLYLRTCSCRHSHSRRSSANVQVSERTDRPSADSLRVKHPLVLVCTVNRSFNSAAVNAVAEFWFIDSSA
jgi:hypothetical protein